MKDINSYFAEKCDIELYKSSEINEHGYYWYARQQPNTEYDFEWSIQDPRCREIIREKFKVHTFRHYSVGTERFRDEWYAQSGINFCGNGKNIAEAEIACLTAIYKTEKTS